MGHPAGPWGAQDLNPRGPGTGAAPSCCCFHRLRGEPGLSPISGPAPDSSAVAGDSLQRPETKQNLSLMGPLPTTGRELSSLMIDIRYLFSKCLLSD